VVLVQENNLIVLRIVVTKKAENKRMVQ